MMYEILPERANTKDADGMRVLSVFFLSQS